MLSDRLAPDATCLTCYLWAQLVLAGLVPATLLLRTVPRQRGLPPGLLEAWLGDQPLAMLLYTAEFCWVLLRAAVGHRFAPPGGTPAAV